MSDSYETAPSKRKHGVDSLLQTLGKSLPVGGSLRLRLIKGPSSTLTADPVDAKAPKQAFPLIAKFPESVVPPDFSQEPWKSGRLYQQDVPKAMDDSDEEEADKNKKKKRWRQFEAPKRQWVLQEQVDFLETMVARREKKTAQADGTQSQRSSRYEGVPEHNPSHYMVLEQDSSYRHSTDNGGVATLSCRLLPAGNSTIHFAQPAARTTLSLSQAQAVMERQKGQPGLIRLPNPTAVTATAPFPLARPTRTAHNSNSKHRLLGKLMNKGNEEAGEEAEDVMADVVFRTKRGASGARKELFSTLADEAVRIGEDGVLGGTNDAIFAARQRFNAFSSKNRDNENGGTVIANTGGGEQERGADGAAMQDDFYQRDVQAEYDELDYDANEQFDDDDVDVGETEVNFDEADYEGDDDDEDDDDLDDEEEAVSGAEGLASIAGFKRMLAKARGEVTTTAAEAGVAEADGRKGMEMVGTSPISQSNSDDKMDHISKIIAAADKATQAVKEKGVVPAKKEADTAAIQVDDNGLRVITQEAVRKEIWLNHGSIAVKRLMKIFDVKKKSSPERRDVFFSVVKELCTMRDDPIHGKLLVLKQHYSNL